MSDKVSEQQSMETRGSRMSALALLRDRIDYAEKRLEGLRALELWLQDSPIPEKAEAELWNLFCRIQR